MNLVRYNTNYDDFLPSAFSNFFNRAFNDQDLTNSSKEVFLPNVDVIEQENSFELQVALPGIKKEDIALDVAGEVLTLKGERKLNNEKQEGKYYSFETHYGTFKRSFRLPKNVDHAKIDASYADGILRINLSKIDDKALKTAIKIK